RGPPLTSGCQLRARAPPKVGRTANGFRPGRQELIFAIVRRVAPPWFPPGRSPAETGPPILPTRVSDPYRRAADSHPCSSATHGNLRMSIKKLTGVLAL